MAAAALPRRGSLGHAALPLRSTAFPSRTSDRARAGVPLDGGHSTQGVVHQLGIALDLLPSRFGQRRPTHLGLDSQTLWRQNIQPSRTTARLQRHLTQSPRILTRNRISSRISNRLVRGNPRSAVCGDANPAPIPLIAITRGAWIARRVAGRQQLSGCPTSARLAGRNMGTRGKVDTKPVALVVKPCYSLLDPNKLSGYLTVNVLPTSVSTLVSSSPCLQRATEQGRNCKVTAAQARY